MEPVAGKKDRSDLTVPVAGDIGELLAEAGLRRDVGVPLFQPAAEAHVDHFPQIDRRQVTYRRPLRLLDRQRLRQADIPGGALVALTYVLDATWNACIGIQGYEENYLDGYIEAAIELADAIIEKELYGKHDTLVLPILYNARHSVELTLKFSTDRLIQSCVVRGEGRKLPPSSLGVSEPIGKRA